MSRKHHPTEFRERNVELHRSGRTASSLSREFGSSTQTILHWVRRGGEDREGEAARLLPSN